MNQPQFSSYLIKAGRAIVETIYPRRCAGCQRRGSWVCVDCDRALQRFAPPWCTRCGAPPALAPCRCDELPVSLSLIRSAAVDEGWLRIAIRSLKYNGEFARSEHLATLLIPLLADLENVDVVTPVPLHVRRERSRGYNQSRLLAEHASREVAIPVRDLLARTRQTGQQVGLDAAERRANVRGAFGVRDGEEVHGKRVVLVDDVLTTGATLANCADALLLAGASWVGAITLAREE